jgi:DNA-binding HxlR family transcriptional regulator
MYTKKIEEDLDCGIRVAFKIFGGKWKPCILDAISRGITRPADMRKDIRVATLRVIEMQLAELLHYGVVSRHTEDTYPKKSEYVLTHFGKTILPVLARINSWGETNAEFVKSKMHEEEKIEM